MRYIFFTAILEFDVDYADRSGRGGEEPTSRAGRAANSIIFQTRSHLSKSGGTEK